VRRLTITIPIPVRPPLLVAGAVKRAQEQKQKQQRQNAAKQAAKKAAAKPGH
jgi:hypothetical protein